MRKMIHRQTIWQMLFWGLLWVLIPFLLSYGWELPRPFIYRHLIVFVGVIALVYVNLEVLLPKLFWKQKTIWYALAGLALIVCIMFLLHHESMPWVELHRRGPPSWVKGRRMMRFSNMRWISLSVPFFTSFIGSSLIAIATVANKRQREAIVLQREKLEAEMKFLKSQINPHFLFNALNNIYTLALIKSDKTAENLLRLSDMLRYVIYDCSAEHVRLNKEIEYLRNYIELQRLKDSAGMKITYETEVYNGDMLIAPMLFVPFVENAFKHSKIEDVEKGWIDIRLEEHEEVLHFSVKNSLPPGDYTKDQIGGVGLKNVRKRLALLYPDSHTLTIKQLKDSFIVSLEIGKL